MFSTYPGIRQTFYMCARFFFTCEAIEKFWSVWQLVRVAMKQNGFRKTNFEAFEKWSLLQWISSLFPLDIVTVDLRKLPIIKLNRY